MNASEYRDLLVEHGLTFEVQRGFMRAIQAGVADSSPDAPVLMALRHGWFPLEEREVDEEEEEREERSVW